MLLSPQIESDLRKRIAAVHPRSVLGVGRAIESLLRAHTRADPACRKIRLGADCDVDTLQTVTHADLGLVVLAELDPRQAPEFLARLRDTVAARLWLLAAPDTPYSDTELVALGFSRIHAYADGSRLFEFDLASYKRDPDWLSPDAWANPQRWNKERW